MAENGQQQNGRQQRAMPPSGASCEYRTLDTILGAPELPIEVNLYAVVTDCTMPRPTRKGIARTSMILLLQGTL